MAELHPKEITVIVTSATGLPAGKGGKCRASVIFGVGKTKFRTQQIDSITPVWNERSFVPVTEGDPSNLVFTVTRKERPLGEVSIALSDLPHKSGKQQVVTLGPCKDCPIPAGTLTYECWISSSYGSPLVSLSGGTGRKSIRGKIGSSIRGSFKANSTTRDVSPRRSDSDVHRAASKPRNMSVTALPVSSALAESNQDSSMSPDGKRRNSFNITTKRADGKRRLSFRSGHNSDNTAMSASNPNLSVVSTPSAPTPMVTGISPRDGSKDGGTVITLRGENLGECLEDIKIVTVCGVACNLGDTEYVSSSKLVCRTPPGKVGNGPVEVETFSQGKGASTVTFTYWDPSERPEDRMALVVEDDASVNSANSSAERNGSFKKKKFNGHLSRASKEHSGPDERDTTIQDLTHRVSDMEVENKRLQSYIDLLICKIMEHNPELLAT